MVEKRPCPQCHSRDNLIYWPQREYGRCYTPGCNYRIGKPPTLDYRPPADLSPLLGIPQRSINEKTCILYSLEQKSSGHIAYPYYRGGNWVYTKFRKGGWTPGTRADRYIDPEGSKPTYFGLQYQIPGVPVVITEGEHDCLATAQATNYMYTVVGVPGADTIATCHASEPSLLSDSTHIICVPQNDAAGQKMLLDLQKIVKPHHLWVVTLPPDVKDCAELVMQGRDTELVQCINAAVPMGRDILVSPDEMVQDIKRYFDLIGGKTSGLSTGFPGLDKLIGGYMPGSITLLAGKTKNGKSTFAAQLAFNYAKLHGKVLFLSLEMKYEETMVKLLEVWYDRKILGVQGTFDVNMYADTIRTIASRIIFSTNIGSLDIQPLEEVTARALQAGCRLIVIDHITIATTTGTDGQSNANIDRFCMTIKNIVATSNSSALLVAQVTDVREEFIKSHHIRGSKVQAQIANQILGITRLSNDRTQVYMLEADRFTGMKGKLELGFSKGRYV